MGEERLQHCLCGTAHSISLNNFEAIRTYDRQTSIHAVTGDRTLLMIRVDFEDLPGAPKNRFGEVITSDDLQRIVNEQVAPFLHEVSYGKTTLTLTSQAVTETLRLPKPAQYYAIQPTLNELNEDAVAKAKEAGYHTLAFNHIGILFSSLKDLPESRWRSAGWAQLGGNRSWFNGSFSPGVFIHELGHNFGLHHAGIWKVPGGSDDPADPLGTWQDYANPFDVMGRSSYDAKHLHYFHPVSLRRLGWLAESAVQRLTSDTTIRLHRYDHPQAHRQNTLAVEIPVSDDTSYWLAYRHKFTALRGAVQITRTDKKTGTTTLFDMTPGASLNDSALSVDRQFLERTTPFLVETLAAGNESEGSEWVDVRIRFGDEVLSTPPIWDVDPPAKEPDDDSPPDKAPPPQTPDPKPAPLNLWLTKYFEGQHASSVMDESSDADQDGVTNLVEYALDRDPQNPFGIHGQAALPEIGVEQGGPNQEFHLTLTLDLPNPLRSDVIYEVCARQEAEDVLVIARKEGENPWEDDVSGQITPLASTDAQRLHFRVRDTARLDTTERRFLFLRVRLKD